jgi:hypothetical protein
MSMTEYRPNKREAADICERLMALTEQCRQEIADHDPDGRTLSLGVTLFAGTFMAAVPEQYRQLMLDVMQGYALTTETVIRRRQPRDDAI